MDLGKEKKRGLRGFDSPLLTSIDGFPQKYSEILGEYSIKSAAQFVGAVEADRIPLQRLLEISDENVEELRQIAYNALPESVKKRFAIHIPQEHGLGAKPPPPRIIK